MNPNPLPHAVIDTQTWVFIFEHEVLDDFNSKQPYRAILESLEAGEFAPVHSPDTIEELRYMLTESKDVAQAFKVDRKLAEYFIDAITAPEVGAVVIEIGEPTPVCETDPDDDYFIETAVAGRVRYLVSEDGDLHRPEVVSYLREHGIRVLYPKQFRNVLKELSPPAEPAPASAP
jgi:predicted nucleic acid-binding protein